MARSRSTSFTNANVLGGPPEQLLACSRSSSAPSTWGCTTQGQLDKYDHGAFAAVLLPFIFDNSAQVYKVLDGPGHGLALPRRWPKARARASSSFTTGNTAFATLTNSVRPINVPDDVKGLKIRTPPELQIQASMEALGGIVQAIAFPELYLALSQKVVAGERGESDRRDLPLSASSTRCRSTSRSPATSTTT